MNSFRDDDDEKVEISQKELRKQNFSKKRRTVPAGASKPDAKFKLFQKGRSNGRPSTKDLIDYGSDDDDEG